jgi:hypothetical protein
MNGLFALSIGDAVLLLFVLIVALLLIVFSPE